MPEDFNPKNAYPEPDDLELQDPSQDFGNRPAAGAPQATPGEVLNTSFQGSANAGDFLGLDVEVGGYDEAAAADGSLDLAAVPPAAPVDADEQAPVYEDEAYAPAEYDEPVYDEEGFVGEGEEGFEDPELAEDFEDVEEPKAARGSFGFVLGAFLIGLTAVAGFVLGPKYAPELMERLGLQSPQVAQNNGGTNTTVPAPTTNGAGTSTEVANNGEGVTGGAELVNLVDPTTETTNEGFVDEVASNDGATETNDANATESGNDAWLDPSVSGPIGDVETTGGTEVTTDNVTAMNDPVDDPWGSDPWGTPTTSGDTATDLGASNALPIDPSEGFQGIQLPEGLTTTFDWASSDKLDMIWRDTTIPLDAIGAASRLLTPRVGFVRVHMSSGEIFEGRLAALGEGQVWVDTQPGRIGLDGERVARFERLAPGDATPGTNLIVTATGERVRVRVPGGVMYGRVVSQEGENVTLITDDGGRVALTEAIVEPLGPARAIVVER